jgi:adenosylhomocysteine nucleosidase
MGIAPAFVTGLVAEARLLRGLGYRVFTGGGTPEGAARCAEAAVAAGATALVSFGLAGGLDPFLPSGALIIPAGISWRGQTLRADPALADAFGGSTCDILLALDSIAATVAEKRRLWAETKAAAIDMESGAVSETAARHGLPFAVLRAICDPAGGRLRPAALAALDHAGRIGFLKVAASVLRHPGQIPALLALASDAARARKTLIGRVKDLASHDHMAAVPASCC